MKIYKKLISSNKISKKTYQVFYTLMDSSDTPYEYYEMFKDDEEGLKSLRDFILILEKSRSVEGEDLLKIKGFENIKWHYDEYDGYASLYHYKVYYIDENNQRYECTLEFDSDMIKEISNFILYGENN